LFAAGVLEAPSLWAIHIQYDGVMGDSVYNSRRQGFVPNEFGPSREFQIGGVNRTGLFISRADYLK
jgi:hypothetical protein